MNKQEAIEKIKNIDTLNINDKVAGQQVDMVIKNQVLDIISQIDEPQKVVVPAFIDSYIRYAKAEGTSLFIAMDNAQNKEAEWIITNEKTFARAYIDGYEIEKEKLYTVEIPNPNGDSNRYGLCKVDGKIIIGSFVFGLDRASNAKLTESEIKQDFDFLWQFAKEVDND